MVRFRGGVAHYLTRRYKPEECMGFTNRIKKEMSEGLIKALLVDAGYRVISSGIESIIRETECLEKEQFYRLGFSKALTSMPDYIVMDKAQTEMHIIDVKYRKNWTASLLNDVHDQVELMGKLTLVCFNANPPSTSGAASAGTFLRCCELKICEGKYLVHKYQSGVFEWVEVSTIINDPDAWYRLAPMQKVFSKLQVRGEDLTLTQAVASMTTIFENF